MNFLIYSGLFLLVSFNDIYFVVEPYNFRTLTSEAIEAPKDFNGKLYDMLLRHEQNADAVLDDDEANRIFEKEHRRNRRSLPQEVQMEYLEKHNQFRREQLSFNMQELVSALTYT